jgi:hypothetical protein
VYIFNLFKSTPKLLIFLYILIILILKYFNILDPLFQYRGENGFEIGGSSLGIGLLNSNIISFTYLYTYSFLAQVFGLFYSGFSSIFVFVTESVIFIYALIFVFRNIKYADKTCIYLICFFIIYTSIWVLGNDNLGTAVRLRVPSYLSMIASWLIIAQIKIKLNEKLK